MDLVSQIGAALDEGGYDADDLARWYWQLEGAITENWRITQAEPLYNLRHEVMEAMSKHLPEHSVEVGPLVPTKQRLEWDRLIRARVDDPDPILVRKKSKDGGAHVLDGHHRVAKAKITGRTTLPAVWEPPRPVPGGP